MEWARTNSKPYYDSTMRWIEDTYLKYFGENRTSYGTKGMLRLLTQSLYYAWKYPDEFCTETLHKAEITGNEDISGIQRSVGDAAANTLGDKGLLGGVGNAVDKGALRGNV